MASKGREVHAMQLLNLLTHGCSSGAMRLAHGLHSLHPLALQVSLAAMAEIA
jgi:hypothetical protein